MLVRMLPRHSVDIGLVGYLIVFFSGVAIILYAVYCITKGEFYLSQRWTSQLLTVKKEENPIGFRWLVGFLLFLGLSLVIVSIFYILFG